MSPNLPILANLASWFDLPDLPSPLPTFLTFLIFPTVVTPFYPSSPHLFNILMQLVHKVTS